MNKKTRTLALVATLIFTVGFDAMPASAQTDAGVADDAGTTAAADDPSAAPPIWGGSADSECRTAIEGASCGPTSEDSQRTFRRLARVCGTEFGSVLQSNSALFAEFQSLWRSCVADTPPPASAAEVPGSVARCGLDGQTPRLRCGGSSDGLPDGQGGGSDSDRRGRVITFCGPGTRTVQDEHGRTRCECIDPHHLIQRVEMHPSVRIEVEGLDEARAAARRYDRTRGTDTTIRTWGCGNSGPTAQEAMRELIRETMERFIHEIERRDCYDENGERREDVTQECRDIWRLMGQVATNTINITRLDRQVTQLRHDFEGWAGYLCHIPYGEYQEMSEDERQDYCREHPGTDSGAGLANLFHFQFGIGGLGIARLHMDVVSLYAMAFAQWEPMFSDSIGLYVRATVGYGTLGDPDGRYGQIAIGESGAWGLMGGLAARLISDGEGSQRRSVLTLNVGAAFYSSLVEGRRGRATGTYRWHDFGIEARLRWEPVRHFGIGAMLGIGWDGAEVDHPDAPLVQGRPDFRTENGAAVTLGLEAYLTF